MPMTSAPNSFNQIDSHEPLKPVCPVTSTFLPRKAESSEMLIILDSYVYLIFFANIVVFYDTTKCFDEKEHTMAKKHSKCRLVEIQYKSNWV
jgi:hypothetical protein